MGGCVVLADGKPRLLSSGVPDTHLLLFPAREVEITRVGPNDATRAIASTGRLAEFRAGWACVTDDGCSDTAGAQALSVEPGQSVQVAPQ